ncbi:MAG: Type 1 glutamine amidotransferase-like domain-containing protein [Chthonomonas sp.]|nr:Type 1 glutamine amidotransferase-like domain-containing protein [Chthonomonas sp.]
MLSTALGSLLISGGGTTTPLMAQKFFELIGGRDQPILVMAQMRESPEESGPSSVDFLKEQGASNVVLCDKSTFTLAEKRTLAAQVFSSKGIWLPGGDQNRVFERLGAAWVQKTFQAARQRGISFFGTSAGAMLMSNPMIGGNNEDRSPKRAEGSGLVPFLVDSHYRDRDRQYRLKFALDNWPAALGVGLSEGDWIIWNERVVESFGNPEWVKGK